MNWLLIISLLVAVLIVLALAAVVIRRSRAAPPPKPAISQTELDRIVSALMNRKLSLLGKSANAFLFPEAALELYQKIFNTIRDVSEGKGLLKIVPESEPVFLLRAKDAQVLRLYAEYESRRGRNESALEAMRLADRMENWREPPLVQAE